MCFFQFRKDVRSDGVSTINKLNVHAPEFTVNRDALNAQSMGMFSANNNQFLQHSKSSGSIQQQMQLAAARRHAVQMANLAGPRVLVQHPLQIQSVGLRVSVPQSQSQSQAPASINNSTNGQNSDVSSITITNFKSILRIFPIFIFN